MWLHSIVDTLSSVGRPTRSRRPRATRRKQRFITRFSLEALETRCLLSFTPATSYPVGSQPDAVAVGDFKGDGKADIVTANTSSNTISVLVNNGDGTFGAPQTYAVGVGPVSVAVGDFNGDGKLDLVITSWIVCNPNCTNNSAVYLLVGNGDGTFQAPTAVIEGNGGLAAADLNGDGKLDLFLGNSTGVAQIYLGNGDGTFSNASNYVGGGFALAVADFNLDGKLDIAVSGSVLLGNGDGTFRGVPVGVVPQSGNLGPYVAGNFQNNGINDVALLTWGATGNVPFYNLNILTNKGAGVLSLTHTYALKQQGYAIVTADFNGDGNLDLAVFGADPSFQSWSVSVLLGNGDGSFQSPLFYSQNVAPVSNPNIQIMTVADFNNDHKPDLAIGGLADSTIAVLLGNGDGSFSAPTYLYSGGDAATVLSADFNGDGNVDIAVGYNSVGPAAGTALLFGNGNGTFQPAIFQANLNGFVPAFTTDFNLDGKRDLSNGNSVALGNGDGTFTVLPPVFPNNGLMYYVFEAVADFNGDGIPDLIGTQRTANGFPVKKGVVLGSGDGTFGPFIDVPTLDPHLIEVVADMNGDGLADIVFPWANSALGVLLNTTQVGPPSPNFQLLASGFSPTPITAGNSATSTTTATPLHGFSGNVALSCTALPAGPSCSFNPASITAGSGTSTLTVTTPSSLAGGSYAVIVSGVSGSISRIAALTLTVKSGSTPDFQISAAAASPASVPPGSSATSKVSIGALNGFNSAVALTCSSGISGVTCALDSTSVTPSGNTNATSTLTINATTAVSPGTYSVTISGTSGSNLHSTSVTLAVAPDFSMGPASGSSTSQTISAGQSASFSLVLTSSAVSGMVNLTCAITPVANPAPTCSLPSSVQLTASGMQPVAVAVGTTAPMTTGTVSHVDFPPGPTWLAWTLMLLGSGWLTRRNRRRFPVLAAPVIALALASWVACGSSSSSHTVPGTPAGTYTATIAASSGSLSHNTTLQVVVQ